MYVSTKVPRGSPRFDGSLRVEIWPLADSRALADVERYCERHCATEPIMRIDQISEDGIQRLVDEFYAKVRADREPQACLVLPAGPILAEERVVIFIANVTFRFFVRRNRAPYYGTHRTS